MATFLTITSLIFSFLATLIITPYWIRRASEHGLVAKDMHKPNKKVPELGGICVICGAVGGILLYIAFQVFVYGNHSYSRFIFPTISSILIATIIGFIDDILGWKLGLRQYQKVILTIAIAFPIMVINAGHSTMTFPFIGSIDLGLMYPLVIIPIGIVGAANGFNMLAGYNGLEAGLGIIILSTLGYISWVTGSLGVTAMSFSMVAALCAFMIFNFYPAVIFPGDVLTYPVGTLIAIIAILGNIEKYVILIFTPYFIQFLLKARGRMQKESFAKVLKDRSLARPYTKYYGIEHIAIDIIRRIKDKVYEKDVVISLMIFQGIFALISMIYFFKTNI